MKTDSDLLFQSTLDEIKEHGYHLLESTWDLYQEMDQDLDKTTKEIFHIKTHYEKLFVSREVQLSNTANLRYKKSTSNVVLLQLVYAFLIYFNHTIK
jgi:hypothetical protein